MSGNETVGRTLVTYICLFMDGRTFHTQGKAEI